MLYLLIILIISLFFSCFLAYYIHKNAQEKVFWGNVLFEVNRKLKATYQDPEYIKEVYYKKRRNAEITEVIKDCIRKVNNV